MEFLGLLLPPLIDLINRKIADSDARLWISVLICSLVGAGLNWLETQFIFATPMAAFDSITASILIVFGLAQLSFKAVWEKTSMHKELREDASK
jgi:apolipoprotein N-acyltransferase